MLTRSPTPGRSIADIAVLLGSWLLATVVSSRGIGQAAEPFYLRDGDRVVFYGDSITEQAHYTRPIEIYLRTRLPELDVSFINSGWSGERAWGGDGGMLEERLERDVIAHRPTVVTVMLGMNDGYYTDFSAEGLKAFQERLEALVATLERKMPGVRITFLGSSPYDNVTPGKHADWERGIEGGYNAVIEQYGKGMQEVAERHELLFVDMNRPLVHALQRLQATHPEVAGDFIPDRIHPGPAAGMLMAAELLAAWHAPVGSHTTHIDATGASGRVLKVRQELPLPFPVDRADRLVQEVLEIAPDIESFRGDTLRVTGLLDAKVSVELDGERLGEFTTAELRAGINLSKFDTTLSRCTAEVAELVSLQDDLRFTRWRNVELAGGGKPLPGATQTAKELTTIEKRLAKLADEMSEPGPHVFEITVLDE